MALSYADLMGYWIKAGGTAEDAPVAAAIAMGESGGNPTSHNSKPPDDSYGLWQINMLGAAGPERMQRWGLTSYSQLFDPLTNAKAAVSLKNGRGNWEDWTVFLTGAWRDYYQGGVPPNLNVSGAGGTADSGDGAANVGFPTVDDLTKNLWASIVLIGNYVYFLLIVGGGLALLFIGFMLLVRETSGGQAVVGTGKAIKRVIPGV